MRCVCGFETDSGSEFTAHLCECPMEPESKWGAYVGLGADTTKIGSLSQQLKEEGQ